MTSPTEIADAMLAAAKPYEYRTPPDIVEKTMRPFGIISTATQRQINAILHERSQFSKGLSFDSWIEANIVVSGEMPDRENRIAFLLMDTCECVLEHLPEAIAHATGPVDERILALLKKPDA